MNHVNRYTKITNADEFIGRFHWPQENPVGFIDAFVDQLDLLKIGFEVKTLKQKAALVLKLLLYLKFIYMVT